MTMQVRETSAEQQEDLQYALGLKRGVCHKLNLADPQQYRYAVNMLKLSGETPETSPQSFAALDAAQTAGAAGPASLAEYTVDEPMTGVTAYNTILSFGTTDQVNYTGTALSSIPGGTAKTTILLTLTAVSDLTKIANVSNTQFAGGMNFAVGATGALPTGLQNDEVAALATFYVYSGSNPIPTVYTQSADDAGTPIAACQNQPTYKQYQSGSQCANNLGPTGPSGPIIACWNRTPGSTADCDYYQVTGQPVTFDFPVIGALTFSAPVSVPITGMFILSLQPPGGGAAIVSNLNATDPSLPLPPQFTVATGATGPAGGMVQWNFPASSFPNNHAIATGGAICDYNCFVSVALNSSTVNTGTGTFTSDSALWQNPATYPVPQIDILYGCLAEGTRIRMADGSEMAVEQFRGGGIESVQSGPRGITNTVWGTTRGKEVPPIIIIRDDQGHELWLTEQHPVPSGGGVVLARDLTVGSRVSTESGDAALTSVERQPYDGDVWNLKVGTQAEAERGETNVYANGILVGDVQMQRYYGELDRRRKVENPLDVLPPEWHQDYRNWLARQGGSGVPRPHAPSAERD
jgi:hypothetical protein